jgi:hypothetical protein
MHGPAFNIEAAPLHAELERFRMCNGFRLAPPYLPKRRNTVAAAGRTEKAGGSLGSCIEPHVQQLGKNG